MNTNRKFVGSGEDVVLTEEGTPLIPEIEEALEQQEEEECLALI